MSHGPRVYKTLMHVDKPALDFDGFRFDGKRRFAKIKPIGIEPAIQYQVGVRLTQGKLTVNLVAVEVAQTKLRMEI